MFLRPWCPGHCDVGPHDRAHNLAGSVNLRTTHQQQAQRRVYRSAPASSWSVAVHVIPSDVLPRTRLAADDETKV